MLSSRRRIGLVGLACVVGFAAGMVAAAAAASDDVAVKQSRSGICHCPGGKYYDGISNFTAFDSLEECLEADGREPKQGQGECLTPLERAEAEIVALKIKLEATENAFAQAVVREHPSAECESMLKWVAGERTNAAGNYINRNSRGNTIIHKDDVPKLVRACRE